MSPAQFSQLRRGDIVQSGGGSYRRVLKVTNRPPYHPGYPPRASVRFKKIVQSGTRSVYTTYTRSDLLTNRYRYIPRPAHD